MKRLLIAWLILLALSAEGYAAQNTVEPLLIEPKSNDCLDTRSNSAIPLMITNQSKGRLAFHLSDPSGPPYELHPHSFSVDFVSPMSTDNVGVILGEVSPPQHEMRLDQGDQAEVHADALAWPSPGYTGLVRVQIKDTHGRQYVSRELAVCPLKLAD